MNESRVAGHALSHCVQIKVTQMDTKTDYNPNIFGKRERYSRTIRAMGELTF